MSNIVSLKQHSQVQGIGPALLSELNNSGIKNSSLTVLLDMVSLEDSGKAIELILKMSQSHKSKFLINSGMVVYRNAEDNVIFGIDEHLQSSNDISPSQYRPLNDISDNEDFQQRKEMREALRGK
jgi:hypothetical protein